MKINILRTLNSQAKFFLFAFFVLCFINTITVLDLYFDIGLGYNWKDVKFGLLMFPAFFVFYIFIKIIEWATKMIDEILN